MAELPAATRVTDPLARAIARCSRAQRRHCERARGGSPFIPLPEMMLLTLAWFRPSADARVRRRILPPLVGTILLLQGIFILTAIRQQQAYLARREQAIETSVSEILDAETTGALGKMAAAMAAIVRDPGLAARFAARDWDALQAEVQPLFTELRDEQAISHFYFHRPDRVVGLRLHSDLRGDLNDRTTIRRAEDGNAHAGLEQGKTGNAVLRRVLPWRAAPEAGGSPQLIGYLELGIEFADILELVTEILDVELVLAVDKIYLERNLWEAKARDLGREPGWENFPQFVVTDNTIGELPPGVAAVLAEPEQTPTQQSLRYQQAGRHYQAIFLPFANVEGEMLGYAIGVQDITALVRPSQRSLAIAIALSVVLSVAAIGLFYALLGRVQANLDASQRQLVSANTDLSQVVGQVTDTSESVAARSQAMSAGAAEVSAGAAEQATATEQASASMAQMVQRIRDNTTSAQQTEAIAQQAAGEATGTRQAMIEAVQGMQAIAAEIRTIEDIALQTNMLALNASIESSHFQGHQQGFAIIASEIRQLAERSQQAAATIDGLTGQSVRRVEQAAQLIEDLVPSIEKTASLVQAIVGSSTAQLDHSTQIDRAIQQLDGVTQRNATTASELSTAAQILVAQANEMQRAIADFQTASPHQNRNQSTIAFAANAPQGTSK